MKYYNCNYESRLFLQILYKNFILIEIPNNININKEIENEIKKKILLL